MGQDPHRTPERPQGLGQAISLALPYASDNEPLLIILGDTLFDADISSLSNAETNILYTYKVADPRRFGVAVTDANGKISKLVEKPQEFVSDEAIVGIYYIKDVKELKAALKHLMDNDIRTKGEFQLTDALQMMIEQGCKFRTAPVNEWLDCGLPETLIETNTWLLNNRIPDCHPEPSNRHSERSEESSPAFPNTTIIPPCLIGKNSTIENSTIGPNVTIGDNCVIKNTQLKNCVVWDNEILNEGTIDKMIVAKC